MNEEGKILITGFPRSGSTFLVALLTRLGIHTGFNEKSVSYAMCMNNGYLEYTVDRITRKSFREGKIPKVIKRPIGGGDLYNIIKQSEMNNWKISYIIITQRNIEDAVQSHVYRLIKKGKYKDNEKHEKLEHHRKVFLEQFRQVCKDASKYSVINLEFPRFVEDAMYLYNKLKPILTKDFQLFKSVFDSTADRKLVHFKDGKSFNVD